ncbi:VOC family protein [Deinococcus saxicola]|uniref:VOC family protein n=1 Tax=Deinococcus saxicola TaxID=249406 RepID=UPI0039F0E382
MITLEHVALKARNLGQTAAFYSLLGAKTSCHAEGQRLFVEFESAARLIFDAADSAPDTSAVTYLGLELASDSEVDALFERVSKRVQIARDVREQYRHNTGPYGFFVADPTGYALKIFNYHD